MRGNQVATAEQASSFSHREFVESRFEDRTNRTIINDDVFLDLGDLIDGVRTSLKIEYCHAGGSIKIKPALAMLEHFESTGQLLPGGRVIESSSGNLGVALAGLCVQRGYAFTCVLDSHASPANVRHLRALGAHIIVCDTPDANGGYLAARIEIIRRYLAEHPGAIWTNQYDNDANPDAHYRWTAPAILRNRPDTDFLFVGCGTTGTYLGCARYMRERAPHVRVVPVDTAGSVTFGLPAAPRFIPGMGTSRRPELVERNELDPPVVVRESDAVRMCRLVARRHGILLGGSSGSVLAGLAQATRAGLVAGNVVTIAADSGERYLETIYDDAWVSEHFPDALQPVAA